MSESSQFCYPNVIDFFGTTLYHLCHFTKNDLIDYQRYNTFTEDNLEKSHHDITEALTNRLNGSEKFYHIDIIDNHMPEFDTYENVFPHIHRKTILIAIYNFCEYQIETLCIEVNKLFPENKIPERWPEKDVMRSFRKLLHSEAGFDFCKIDKPWQYLQTLKLIRNTLVHSEGEINQAKTNIAKKINVFCQKNINLRLDKNQVIIEQGFIEEIIAELTSLFQHLETEVFAFIRRYEAENGCFELDLPPGVSKFPS